MSEKRLTPAAGVLLLMLVLAPALSGCSVSVIDPSSEGAQTEQAPPSSTSGDDGSDADEDAAPASTPPSGQSSESQREALLAAASTTMSCPDGPLTSDGDIVRIEGPCADLVIEIDAGAVIADDVDTLTLSGSGTTVFVENVKTLRVTGSASSVFWTGSTPDVTDDGAANILKRG